MAFRLTPFPWVPWFNFSAEGITAAGIDSKNRHAGIAEVLLETIENDGLPGDEQIITDTVMLAAAPEMHALLKNLKELLVERLWSGTPPYVKKDIVELLKKIEEAAALVLQQRNAACCTIPEIVYVVVWQYDTGGGFDWYYEEPVARIAYDRKRQNVDNPDLAVDNWHAVFFSYKHHAGQNRYDVTVEINNDLSALVENAVEKYPAKPG